MDIHKNIVFRIIHCLTESFPVLILKLLAKKSYFIRVFLYVKLSALSQEIQN